MFQNYQVNSRIPMRFKNHHVVHAIRVSSKLGQELGRKKPIQPDCKTTVGKFNHVGLEWIDEFHCANIQN